MKRKLFKTETVVIKNSRYHYLIQDGEKTPLTSGEFAEISHHNKINYLLNKIKK